LSLFCPTRPPAIPSDPTLTAPLAQVRPSAQLSPKLGLAVLVIVPKFWPTSPPTIVHPPRSVPFALDVTFPRARESLMIELGPLIPTTPPGEELRPVMEMLPVA